MSDRSWIAVSWGAVRRWTAHLLSAAPARGALVALSFGLVVALAVYAFGTTSGAHINPAVTVTLAATGRFPWRDAGPYVLAQLVGAVVGALLVVASFGTGSVDTSAAGAVSFGEGVGYPQAILVEALATFLLLLTIAGRRHPRPGGLGRADDRSVGDLPGLATVRSRPSRSSSSACAGRASVGPAQRARPFSAPDQR